MLTKRFFKTKSECEVTFRHEEKGVTSVSLLIDAQGWKPLPMKQLKSGPFQTKLRLPNGGVYEFRYLVNESEWVNDVSADGYRWNNLGSQNGIISTMSDN